MKVNVGIRSDASKQDLNNGYNASTFKAYVDKVKHLSRSQNLSDMQKTQIVVAWKSSAKRKVGAKGDLNDDQLETAAEKHLQEVQQHAIDMHEMLEEM